MLLAFSSLLSSASNPNIAPVSPNWLVAAPVRKFRVAAPQRAFQVAAPPRVFRIVANAAPFVGDFSAFDPSESPVFTIDFGPQVSFADGVATGFEAYFSIATYQGVDPNAGNLLAKYSIVSPASASPYGYIQIKPQAIAGVGYRLSILLNTANNKTVVLYGHALCAPVN
jgi:hypothetical protein